MAAALDPFPADRPDPDRPSPAVIQPTGRALGRRRTVARRTPSPAGPAAGGGICEQDLETSEVLPNRPQPLPRPPVPELRPSARARVVGSVRLPIGGPYRPRADLHVDRDGTEYWTVRLWEIDRPVVRRVDTATLRTFAERNRLPELQAAIEQALAQARIARGP